MENIIKGSKDGKHNKNEKKTKDITSHCFYVNGAFFPLTHKNHHDQPDLVALPVITPVG